MSGTLYVVGTPIGNPDDITLRALRIFNEVEWIVAEDPATTERLLKPHGIGTPITSYQNLNKEEKVPVLLQRLAEGASLALVCDAGTPLVCDPGALLVSGALRAGVRVVPVPGPSAVVAPLSVAGVHAETFVFLGQLPKRASACRALIVRHCADPRTHVLFLTGRELPMVLTQLEAVAGDREVLVACDLTGPGERLVRDVARNIRRALGATPVHGPVTLVLGPGRPRSKAGSGRATPSRPSE